MKKTAVYLMILALAIGTLLPVRAAAGETRQSGISWYLNLYGYSLPEDVQGKIQSNIADMESLEVGGVVITAMETLYDGYWVYAAATVEPVAPEKDIIMPGSAAMGDLVSGGNGETARGDGRTFLQAAKEDNKRLLCVYIYPKEFDVLPFYFLDHRQDAGDRSTLISGSRLDALSGGKDIRWSIQIYEVDKQTGSYSLITEHEMTDQISPMGEVEVRSYVKPAEEIIPLQGILLIRTALTTYAIPAWTDESDEGRYELSLLDDSGEEINKGTPPDVNTFSMERLPEIEYTNVRNL